LVDEKTLKERLLRENEEFRKIHEEHQALERSLEKLKAKGSLNEDDVLKEKELKKRKLALKDRMYGIMSDFAKRA
jgi:hypothetical protein